MKNNTSKLFVTVGAAFALILGISLATPAQAHAFSLGQIIDPGCFFACSSGGGGHSTKTVTNYYNGNYRSPGGTVVYGNVTTAPATTPAPVSTAAPSQNYSYSGGNTYYYTNNAPVQNVPTYAYNYNPAPVYSYGSSYSYYSQPVVQPVVQPVYQPVYEQPVYSQPVYAPLYVSCTASSNYGTVGTPIVWSAYATGGSGYYTYTWSGIDGLYGSGQTAYITYQNPGYKTASVTVYSNGQTYTQNCSDSVTISAPYIVQPIAQPVAVPVYPAGYRSTNYNGLDVGCYADPSTASPNQPITWNVEVTGGVGPYTYSWTGTDGLTGSAASVIKYYSTGGTKNAVVTVTSADGRNAVHACSNTVAVRSAAAPVYHAPAAPKAPVAQPVQTNNGKTLSAASLFSLANIPWGWVSILIILILFATVVYLMFNKPKI